MEEIKILDNYVVHTEGNYAKVVDTRTNKVIDEFNIKTEMFKQSLKKAGLITLATIILATSVVAGVKHKKANLEARTNNVIQVNENNPRQYQNLTFYPEEKEEGDSIYSNINKVYQNISSMGLKVPEFIDKPYIRTTIFVESSDNPNIPSEKGAEGYPQTYYSTWKDVFPDDSFRDFQRGIKNKERSIEFIVKHFLYLDKFNKEKCPGYNQMNNDEKRILLAAEYNWGQGKLQDNDWDLTKAPKETRNHIKKMQIAYARFS